MNYIIKKGLYEPATVELEYFYSIIIYFYKIPFWERQLSIHIRKRLMFLDVAMTQYFTKIL